MTFSSQAFLHEHELSMVYEAHLMEGRGPQSLITSDSPKKMQCSLSILVILGSSPQAAPSSGERKRCSLPLRKSCSSIWAKKACGMRRQAFLRPAPQRSDLLSDCVVVLSVLAPTSSRRDLLSFLVSATSPSFLSFSAQDGLLERSQLLHPERH